MSKRISPSHDEVVAALLKYETSDTINPTFPGTTECVYDDGFGRHCIAGQVVVDLGGEIPFNEFTARPLNGTISVVHEQLGEFDFRSLELLRKAQNAADQMVPWSKVIDQLRQDGAL